MEVDELVPGMYNESEDWLWSSSAANEDVEKLACVATRWRQFVKEENSAG